MSGSIALTDRSVLAGASRAARGRDTASVRRYRVARLRLEGRGIADAVRGPLQADARFAHLKRIYD